MSRAEIITYLLALKFKTEGETRQAVKEAIDLLLAESTPHTEER